MTENYFFIVSHLTVTDKTGCFRKKESHRSIAKNRFVRFCFSMCFLLLSAASFAQWTDRATGVKPRSELTSVSYEGKVYAFFGFRDSLLTEVEPSAEVYDPVTDTWTLLDSVPAAEAVSHARLAVIDDMVWHVGGRVGKHPGPLTSHIWIYNITLNKWFRGPELTDPATGKPLLWAAGGVAFLGRTLHVFGGFVIDACDHDQDTYHLTLDVDEWLADPSQPPHWKNELAPMPVKRNHLSTVVLGGKIYAIGGQFGHDCSGGQDQRYSHVYDPSTNKWTALPQLPAARSHTEGSCFAIDGKIYLAGGQSTSGTNSDKITVFDPAANNGTGAWIEDKNFMLPYLFETLSANVIDSAFIISHGGQPRYKNPRAATHARVFKRNPVYKLGFLPACAEAKASLNSVVKTKTLLFTIDGSASYLLSSNVPWLTVTKNAVGIAVRTAVDVEATINTAGLAPGTYYGLITATPTGDDAGYTAAQYCVNLTVGSVGSSTTTLEAEKAKLKGATVASNYKGYTGTGFVDYVNSSGDYIEWTVNKATAGAASLKFRYANGGGSKRTLKLTVNNVTVASSLSFAQTGGWTNWSTISYKTNLNAGSNKIRLTATGSNGPNIDNLVVSDIVSTNAITTASELRLVSDEASPTNFAVSVAPNPASGKVKISWGRASDEWVQIAITDLSGHVHKQVAVPPNSTEQTDFSVAHLPAGLYIVSARQGKEQASAKLLVRHE